MGVSDCLHVAQGHDGQSRRRALRGLLGQVKFCKDSLRYRAGGRLCRPGVCGTTRRKSADPNLKSMPEIVLSEDAVTKPDDAALIAALGARSVVLVGMMGSGKSSIGRRLAARLAIPFVDADAEI